VRRKRNLIIGTVIVAGAIIYGVVAAISSSVRLDSDFRDGAQGWEAGFVEYSPDTEDMMLGAETKPLPPELGINGTGYYLQGMNHSDDLFMFLKRRLGPDDGVVRG